YIPQHYYSRSCLDPSFFFFHATSTLDTYPFSLPDALPISRGSRCGWRSATSRISERSSGRRNAASPPLSAVPPDASSRARSSRTGSRPSPSSPPPTPTGSTPTCEHPAYTDQLTGPRGMPARHGGGGWSDRDREPPPAVLAAPPRQDQRPAGPHPTAHHPHPAGPDPVEHRHQRRRRHRDRRPRHRQHPDRRRPRPGLGLLPP